MDKIDLLKSKLSFLQNNIDYKNMISKFGGYRNCFQRFLNEYGNVDDSYSTILKTLRFRQKYKLDQIIEKMENSDLKQKGVKKFGYQLMVPLYILMIK